MAELHPFLKWLLALFSGWLGFAFVGQIPDALLTAPGVAANQRGDFARGNVVLNIMKPVSVTLCITGLGALVMGLLGVGTLGSFSGFAWFFFLTQFACLSGRFIENSIVYAGRSMLVTFVLVVLVYLAAK